MGKHSVKAASPNRGRRYLALAGSVAIGVGLITGVAGASSTTSEGIVTIPAHTLTTGATIAAGKSVAYVVSGGSTTVPTDADRVQLAVTVSKQQKAGSLTAQPYLDPADASGDTLSWAAPNSMVTGTVLEPVGLSNKVALTNTSAGSVSVAVKIIGYSTGARLAARLDTAENNIAGLQTNVANLQAINAGPRLSTAESNISNLQAAGAAVRRGFQSSSYATYAAGSNWIMVTPTFTPTMDMTCLVTSSVQISVQTAVPVGTQYLFVRNAYRVDGTPYDDTYYGHYVTSNGVAGFQPDISRTSTINVTAGHQVQFGAFLYASAAWAGTGNYATVATSYDCR